MYGSSRSRVSPRWVALLLLTALVLSEGGAFAGERGRALKRDAGGLVQGPNGEAGAGRAVRHELLFVQQVPRPAAADGGSAEPMVLSLQEAVYLALLNNRDIKIERLTPRIREEETRRERAGFHPSFTVDGSTDRTQGFASNLLAGATAPVGENVDLNSGLKTRLLTGAVASLDLKTRRNETNNAFDTLNPKYSTALAFTLTQPLLKDFGPAINRTRIKVAENTLGISRHQLKATITNVLLDVETTYWDLVLTSKDVEVRRRALEVARRLAERTQALVADGRLPEISVLQAQLAVLEKEGDVVVAENAYRDATHRLKDALGLDRNDDLSILPLDQPTSEPRPLDLEEARKAALERRPEPPQARLDVETKRLGVGYAKNQTLPQLNLFGSYGLSGLAGTPTSPCPALPFGVTIKACLPPENLSGEYGASFENLFSGESPTWKVGINLTIPLGNVAARSELRKAELELEKAQIALRSVEARIVLEVERTGHQIRVGVKLIEASRALKGQAQRRLEMVQEQFELGLAPMTAVLEALNDLASAERAELKALADYNKALALFDKATGATLERFRVEL